MNNLKKYFENNNRQAKFKEWLNKRNVIISDPDETQISDNVGGFSQRDIEYFWDVVESVEWTMDYDYDRIKNHIKLNYPNDCVMFKNIFDYYTNELYQRFEDDWLERNGGIGIEASDDSWSDLRAEVIGRGKEFYTNITAEQLKRMGDTRDYRESFAYAFNFDD